MSKLRLETQTLKDVGRLFLSVADMAELALVDAALLPDQQPAFIRNARQYAVLHKTEGSGDLKPVTGPGYWLVSATPGDMGTQTQLIIRNDSITKVAPTAGEWPSPNDTDRSIVVLADDTVELSEYQTDKWVLLQTIPPTDTSLLVAKADKATALDIASGTKDKWVDAEQLKDSKQIGRGNALPADNTQYEVYILEGHASISDGWFYWSVPARTWVQGR
jgi:hypothetical protein